MCARGELEAISDVAQFLPVTIMAELMGLTQAVGSDQMLKWAAAMFNLFGTEKARTDHGFGVLMDRRDFLQECDRRETLKDGGWANRIFEVGAERGISYATCA